VEEESASTGVGVHDCGNVQKFFWARKKWRSMLRHYKGLKKTATRESGGGEVLSN
jgi:hypothetical protein